MNARASMATLLRRALWTRVALDAAVWFGRSMAGLAAVGLLLLILDTLVPLSMPFRWALWGTGVAAAVLAALAAARPWRRWRFSAVALAAGGALNPPDQVLTAWRLSAAPLGEGVSGVLVERSVQQTLARAESLSWWRVLRPAHFVSWASSGLVMAGALAALTSLLPGVERGAFLRAFFPFAAEDSTGLSVSPGDHLFPAGESVTVEVSLDHARGGAPEIWVKPAGGRWEKRTLQTAAQGRRFQVELARLMEPLQYKARFRGLWTRVYTLTPFHPPRLETLRAEVRYPSYARKPQETIENALTLRVLRGAQVRFRAAMDQKLAKAWILLEDGRTWATNLDGARNIEWSLEAYEPARGVLNVETQDMPGRAQAAADLSVDIAPDEAPRIQILSPAQDLLASPRDKIPVTYEVADDFGVSEVWLSFQRNGAASRKETWRRFSADENAQGIFDRVWNLSDLGLSPGDRLRYHLVARDNNTLTGPSEAASASFEIEIASYDTAHDDLEKQLAEIRKGLVEAMGEESLLRENLDESPAKWQELQQKQAAVGKKIDEQIRKLDEAVKKMEQDPLSDQVTGMEHKAILSNLQSLRQDALRRAEEALRAQQKPDAARAMDEAVSELERLSLLSEDVLQSQNMRDLLNRQEDLSQTAENMAEELAAKQGQPLSPEDQQRLQSLLEEAGRMMQAIADAVKKMPQTLPEDFVNQEGIKNLRFDQVQEAMRSMQDALSAGDAKQALASAREMVERLKEMQKTLQKAADSVPGGPSWFGNELAEKMKALQDRLGELAQRQETLRDKTQSLTDKALPRLWEKEKVWAGEFSGAWEALARDTGELEGRFAGLRDPALALEARMHFQRLKPAWEALKPPTAFSVTSSSQNWSQVSAAWEALQSLAEEAGRRAVKPDQAPADVAALNALAQDAGAARGRAAKLAADFERRPAEGHFLTSEEKAGLGPLSVDQSVLEKDTKKFRQDLQMLARQTALLGTPLSRRLQLAAEAMNGAAAGLNAAALRAALGDQDTALKYLRESQDDMSSAAQSMSGMGGAAGRPMAGSLQARPGSGSGGAGSRVGPVRLPRAEDHRPPREFREEVLKSMNEQYPKTYESIIKDYYEKWAK